MDPHEGMAPAPDSHLVDLLRSRAAGMPSRTAYRFLRDDLTIGDEIDYATLALRARAIAARLQQRTAPGDRALMLYPPGLEFLSAFLGCLHAGVIAVPAYPPRGRELDARIQAIAGDAAPAVGLAPTALMPAIEASTGREGSLAAVPWLSTDEVTPVAAGEWREWTPSPDTVAHLQYTSGSTATPKGVIVTHRNLLQNLLDMHLGWRHDADSVILSWLPHFHDMGLVYGFLEPLFAGVPGYLMAPITFIQRPVRWLQAISTFGVTHSVAPNFAYDLCARKVKVADRAALDLGRWRVAVNGAEPIRAETLQQFASVFAPCGFREDAFCPGYGLAEATLKVTACRAGEAPRYLQVDAEALDRGAVQPGKGADTRTLVSCGRTEIDTVVAIVDPATRVSRPEGTVGEVWVGGSTVAAGYWQRPEETAASFHAMVADTGGGPFLRTGDLGFLLDGDLYINGRIKDLIVIRGQNHYPQDIELTVEHSHPACRRHGCAAFSVDIDGAERLIVVQELEREARAVDPEELAGAVRQVVAETHEIGVYDVVFLRGGGLPRTSSGKIQRHACRRAYLDGTFRGQLPGVPS